MQLEPEKYRKTLNTSISIPCNVATDSFEIHEYRSMSGFSVPPYAHPNYVPLVWSDFGEGAIKLLKVPVVTDN
jgi:hypothetical protein